MQQVEARIEHVDLNFEQIPTKFREIAFKESANALNSQVKKESPVDTGKLKASWKVTHNTQDARIHTSTSYADFVDSGTRYIKPRHYTKKAINQFRRVEFPKIVRRSMLRALKDSK